MKLDIVYNEKNTNTSLFSAIVIFIVGALIFTNPEAVVKFASYVIGALFLIYGLYMIYNYSKSKQNLSLVSAVLSFIVAIVFIFLAGVIEHALRYLIGAWILFNGVTKLVATLTYNDRKDNRFVTNLIISILLIILGFYIILVSNLVLSTIGILIMIYAGIEIVGYIFNYVEGKKYEKQTKKVKEEIKDAVIVEKPKSKKKKSK